MPDDMISFEDSLSEASLDILCEPRIRKAVELAHAITAAIERSGVEAGSATEAIAMGIVIGAAAAALRGECSCGAGPACRAAVSYMMIARHFHKRTLEIDAEMEGEPGKTVHYEEPDLS